MRIFVVSDTHEYPDKETALHELGLIAKTSLEKKCDIIIHCGDMENEHFGHPALGALPIYIIRTRMNEKLSDEIISKLPANWHVLPDEPQVLEFGIKKKLRIFIHHYMGVNVLGANLGMPTPEAILSEEADAIKKRFGLKLAVRILKVLGKLIKSRLWSKLYLYELVEKLQKQYGYMAYALCGHSHHQFAHSALGTLVINPGAFGYGYDKYKRSYAIIDTRTWDVTLGVASPK